jgi:hypothetical protein
MIGSLTVPVNRGTKLAEDVAIVADKASRQISKLHLYHFRYTILLSESSLLLSVELSTAAASYRRRCLFLVCCGGVTARRCLGRRGSAVRGAGALSGGAGVVCTAGGRIHMSSSSSELRITIAAGPSSACSAGPSSAFAAVFV